MKPYAVIIGIGMLICLAVPPGSRGAELPGSGTVTITADTISHEQEHDRYEATGKVEIRWDGTVLTSDRAVVSQELNEAVAEGGVALRKGGDLLRGDRLKLNYETDQGDVENGDLFIAQRNFHLRSRKMAKVGDSDYHLERGSFTTCDGPEPSWHFTASDLDVTLDKFAQGRDAVFYIGSFPVFYTPYILFPVKLERQSGFLFPRIGSSLKKGFIFDLPYYWAISPSQEVTFDIDLQTKRGVGGGADYNYLAHNGSHGSLKGYVIYDTQLDRVRGSLSVQQLHALTPTVDFRSDIHLVLDREFYKDYGEASGDFNRQLLDSSVSLSKRWQEVSLSAEGRYLDDLYAANNHSTLQRLPTLSGNLVGSRLGALPLYASLAGEYTHFQRDTGIMGERLTLHPTLMLYWPEPAPVQMTLWGGYRQRVYDATGAPAGEGYQSDGLADAGAALSTVLAKVYPVSGGELRRLKHTLVSELGYNFTQEKLQDTLPFFDYDDRVKGGSLASWSLTNYLTGRFQHDDAAPEYRDLLYLKLSQGYQLAGARRDLLTLVDDGHPFTDIRLEARFTPLKQFSLSTDNRYDPYRSGMSTAAVAADLSDAGGNSIGGGYRFIRGGADYLEGRLGLALVKPFIFQYTGRYSAENGEFLESYYSLEYKKQCWSVVLTYRDRPDNREFMVSFTLAGVGTFGPLKAF